MLKLTKKQRGILKKYESHFKNAQAGFCRGVYQVDINEMEPIYESLGFHLGSASCGECVLTMINNLAKFYFDEE